MKIFDSHFEKYLNESPFRFATSEIASALKVLDFISNEAGGLTLHFESGQGQKGTGKVYVEVGGKKQGNMQQKKATDFLSQYL